MVSVCPYIPVSGEQGHLIKTSTEGGLTGKGCSTLNLKSQKMMKKMVYTSLRQHSHHYPFIIWPQETDTLHTQGKWYITNHFSRRKFLEVALRPRMIQMLPINIVVKYAGQVPLSPSITFSQISCIDSIPRKSFLGSSETSATKTNPAPTIWNLKEWSVIFLGFLLKFQIFGLRKSLGKESGPKCLSWLIFSFRV